MLSFVTSSCGRARGRAVRRLGLSLMMTLGLTTAVLAQTDPPAQGLPYTQDFASLTPASVTALPAGWASWTIGAAASATYRTTAAIADLAVTANGTAASDTGAVYNYLDKPGFLDSDSVDAALALAINTSGKRNIVVGYDIMTVRNPADGTAANDRISLTALQYRVGTTGSFTTLDATAYANDLTQQVSGTTGQQLATRSITLPADADDAAVVQLRWVSRDSTGAGARPSIALDNLSVTGTDFFTITAAAGANGSLSPSGAVVLDSGASQLFTITPDPGYVVQDVLVDGVSQGAITTYTFTAVTANHTLSASFTPNPVSVIDVGSPGGFVTTVAPALAVPVTLTRVTTTPMLGFSVDLTLSPGLTTSPSAIVEGGFLTASGGTTNFQVTDHGDGSYTVDGVTLGLPCGSSATSGTLFTIGVGSTLTGGAGTVTVTAVSLRECSNTPLPVAIGATGTVDVDRSTPAVAVTSPNGGESWLAGSVHAVTWTASDAEGIAANSVVLEYTADDGSNWLPVASDLANSGSYSWTVPATASAAARVRASAADVHANVASDASDAVFTIQGTTTTSLASAPEPSVTGEGITLTATVSPAVSAGSVEFFDGPASLGIGAVLNGNVVISSVQLAPGTHSLTAVYSGSALHTGSTSDVHTHTVNPAATTTSLASAPNPSVFGESVTFTATVAADPPGSGTATGAVELFDGATSLGLATLSGGTATLSTSALTVGAHSITAVYAGDAGFTGSTSAVHGHTVDAAGTTTSLVSDLNPSTFGQSVTFTATVSVTAPGAGAPSGSVTFFDGVTPLGSSTVAAGSATFATSALSAGTHGITASYSGDSGVAGSTSSVLSQVVNAAAATVTLAAAPDPGVHLDPETLTATVSPAAATGSVEFFDGASSLGSSPVSAGTATLVTSALSVAVHSLTAVYSGDADHSGATSSAVSLEVQARIVATAGPNGGVTPSGTILVSLGGTPSFSFAADAGYHVASVTVDGGAVASTSPYTFAPVSSNHTIDVQFAANPAVAAISTLAATQVRTGNDADGTTRITLTWTPVPAGSTVEVWRAGYGNYPEYDDGPTPGSVPATPASYPPAGWTLTAVTSPGDTDEPATRDVWYYVAYVRDSFGTVSPVSNQTGGTLDYHLGDITDGVTAGAGDNLVVTADLSVLGAHYGIFGPAVDPYDYLDVGPTSNASVNGRPMTDNRVNFEDLVMFALNFFPITSAPQAHARPAGAARDALTIQAPAHAVAGEEVAVRIDFSGTGRMQAVSARLSWDPAVVEPVSYTAGDAVLAQDGLVLSAEPGMVDGASFAGAGQGLVGEGEFATVRFRVVAAGEPRFGFARVDARDSQNRSLRVETGVLAPAPRTFVTAFAPAMPNPFGRSTTFAFSLAKAGRAELEVYSVDGRRVRTVTSGVREAGEYRVEWNGTDDAGRTLAAGVYYARLTTAQGRWTRLVTFLR